VDVKTGTIRLAALFPNPGDLLRPGQFARVRALRGTRQNALLVPQRSVTELQGGFQVAVVGPDNKVTIRTVKAGERVGSQWVIDEGLKPGERVVVEGVQKVREGQVVTPKAAAELQSGPGTSPSSEIKSDSVAKTVSENPPKSPFTKGGLVASSCTKEGLVAPSHAQGGQTAPSLAEGGQTAPPFDKGGSGGILVLSDLHQLNYQTTAKKE
jgi:hypothetical protein